jgi:succinate dehydrogenase hydrophobic anchor subunit
VSDAREEWPIQKITGIAMTVLVTGLLTWAGASIVERNETMAKLSERVAVIAVEVSHVREKLADMSRDLERLRKTN